MVWEMLKSDMDDKSKYALLLDWDKVLGLNLNEAAANKIECEVPNEIQILIERRDSLRKEEKWEEADEVRKKIEEQGFIIEDSPKGHIIRKK